MKLPDPTAMANLLVAHYAVPDALTPGIVRYLHERIEPGGFLMAVLKNDLMEAAVRGDDRSIECLPGLARFLLNEAPVRSYGTPEKVAKWLASAENT